MPVQMGTWQKDEVMCCFFAYEIRDIHNMYTTEMFMSFLVWKLKFKTVKWLDIYFVNQWNNSTIQFTMKNVGPHAKTFLLKSSNSIE